jgi:hypothetical protein
VPRPIRAAVVGSGTAVSEKLSIAIVSLELAPDEAVEANSLKKPLETLSTDTGTLEIVTVDEPHVAASVTVAGEVVRFIHVVPFVLTSAIQVVDLDSTSNVKKSKEIVDIARPVLLKLKMKAAPGSPIVPVCLYPNALLVALF